MCDSMLSTDRPVKRHVLSVYSARCHLTARANDSIVVCMNDDADDALLRYLGPELLKLLLRPPPTPKFARETERPKRAA